MVTVYELCKLNSCTYKVHENTSIVALYREPDGSIGYAKEVPADFGHLDLYKDWYVLNFDVSEGHVTIFAYPEGFDTEKGMW